MCDVSVRGMSVRCVSVSGVSVSGVREETPEEKEEGGRRTQRCGGQRVSH